MIGNGERKTRIEFRIKGASQFSNLVSEKLLNHSLSKRDKKGLIKLPNLDFPTPLDSEMCERLDLPRAISPSRIMTDEEIAEMEKAPQSEQYLSLMRKFGIPFEKANESWREYIEAHHSEMLTDEELMQVVDHEDRKYVLGATFGQTTRILESPFRIMELSYYIEQTGNPDISDEEREKARSAIDAMLELTTRGRDDYLHYFSDVSARNAAGFINARVAMDNFEHRQDFPLSGEICDDAFDDVSEALEHPDSKEGYHSRLQYYSQVYLFVTNAKIMADAFRLTGRAIPTDFKRHFIEVFYESLEDKNNFIECFKNPDPMEAIRHFPNGAHNFEGMEDFMREMREVAAEVFQQHGKESHESKPQRGEQNPNAGEID
jgi:hypothetical protein